MLYSGASGHGFGIFRLTLVPTHYDRDRTLLRQLGDNSSRKPE
ncbi:MAG TPA: hypothetical protein VIC08_09045 [Cellvibrionaceae bacterium]